MNFIEALRKEMKNSLKGIEEKKQKIGRNQ